MSKQIEIYEDTCAICLGTWCQGPGQVLCVLPCKHAFGLTCFQKLERTSCPTCRHPFDGYIQHPQPNANDEEEEESETGVTNVEITATLVADALNHPSGYQHFPRHPHTSFLPYAYTDYVRPLRFRPHSFLDSSSGGFSPPRSLSSMTQRRRPRRQRNRNRRRQDTEAETEALWNNPHFTNLTTPPSTPPPLENPRLFHQ